LLKAPLNLLDPFVRKYTYITTNWKNLGSM
jgi:hypothetical protein